MSGWTEHEDATLRRMIAAGETFEAVGDRLGRTRGAIAGRASRLGIKSPVIKIEPEPVPGSAKGIFSHRSHGPGRAFLLSRRRKAREQLNQFADALAERGTIKAAAAAIGVCEQRGSQLFAIIKREIDGPQEAAGFGRWCR